MSHRRSRSALERDSKFRVLCDTAREQGWTIAYTGRNHLQFLPPSGRGPVFYSATPSDHRGFYTLRSKLRRAGLNV